MTASETATDRGEADVLAQAVATAGDHAWIGRALSFPLRRGWLDVTYTGLENVPSTGPVVLAANHLAFIDSMLVMYGVDRPVHFLGKAEYLDHPVARRLFPMTGMLPLDRTGRRSRVTLDRVDDILNDGGIVGLHPEGTRSRDGQLLPGHRGVAQIALRAGAPIVPIGLIGTGEAQPVGQLVPSFRSKVEVRIGAPIGLGPWSSNRRSATARTELTNEVMRSIAALSGQTLAPTPDQLSAV
jgi:1-acyl-sn-glycerol-3-phosphate acyltransferase